MKCCAVMTCHVCGNATVSMRRIRDHWYCSYHYPPAYVDGSYE